MEHWCVAQCAVGSQIDIRRQAPPSDCRSIVNVAPSSVRKRIVELQNTTSAISQNFANCGGRQREFGVSASDSRSLCRAGALSLVIPLPPARFPNPGNTQCGNAFGVAGVNWVVTCLSELDRQDIFDRFDQTVGGSSTVNLALSQLHLAVLTCPDDDSQRQQATFDCRISAAGSHR